MCTVERSRYVQQIALLLGFMCGRHTSPVEFCAQQNTSPFEECWLCKREKNISLRRQCTAEILTTGGVLCTLEISHYWKSIVYIRNI